MTTRSSFRSNTRSDWVTIPAQTLLASGLNLNEVDIRDGRVTFTVNPEAHTITRLKRGLDVKHWRRVEAARQRIRRQAQRGLPKPEFTINPRSFFVPPREEGKAPLALQQALFEAEVQAAEIELRARAGPAIDTMHRLAMVRYAGQVYMTSTLSPGQPEIVMQVADRKSGEDQALENLAFAAEIILEVGLGLLTILGFRVRGGRRLTRWVRRLMQNINANRKLKAAILRFLRNLSVRGAASLSAKDLVDLLLLLWSEGAINPECLRDAASDLIDLTFWGLLALLAKLAARAVPGAGQALLIAEIGHIVSEIVEKLTRPT